jgi:N-acetylmuramoyl-L-alanine amidase
MKTRVTSFLLALLAVTSVTLTGSAAGTEGTADVTASAAAQQTVVDTQVEIPVYEPGRMYFYLDGQLLTGLVSEGRYGVNYVTVESFISAMDPEAMVEEENGVVTVTATSVTGVEDVATAQPGTAGVVEETLTLTAAANATYLTANGRCIPVDNGLLLVDGKVAAPIRVLAKVFNLSVGYNGTVLLNHQAGASAYLTSADSYYDSDALYWLSRIIHAESSNQSLDGKVAVGNVVMNRVASPLFPNTVYSVVFQKNQFSPASSGTIYRTPSAESVVAAKLVLEGAVALEKVLFFNRAGLTTSYAARNRTYVATIGAHAFYA